MVVLVFVVYQLTDFLVDLGVPRVISGGSRPADKGRGHPVPEIRGGEGGVGAVSKKFFSPFGPQFALKIRGSGRPGAPSQDPQVSPAIFPLPWITYFSHCLYFLWRNSNWNQDLTYIFRPQFASPLASFTWATDKKWQNLPFCCFIRENILKNDQSTYQLTILICILAL